MLPRSHFEWIHQIQKFPSQVHHPRRPRRRRHRRRLHHRRRSRLRLRLRPRPKLA